MKKKIPYIIAGLIPVFVFVFFFVNKPAQPRDLTQIMEEGRLSVLIESGISGFTKDSLKVYGFQYEIIRRFVDELGIELVVINKGNEENGFDELEKGNCDILVSFTPVINDTNKNHISLTPIINTRLMLIQKKDSSGMIQAEKQYMLDKQIITVMKSSPYIQRIHDLADELAIQLQIQEENYVCLDDMAKAVEQQKIQYSICEEYIAKGLLKKYPGLDISVPLNFNLDLSWCVHTKSVKLKEKLNEFLDEFVGSVEYQRLYQQYFPENK